MTTTSSANLSFSTSNQGMWGAGAPSNLGAANVNLFTPVSWNKSASWSDETNVSVDSNLDVDSTSSGDTDGDASNDTDYGCTILNNDWNPFVGSEYNEINGQDNDNDVSSDGTGICADSNLDADYINVDTDGDANADNDDATTTWGADLSASTAGSFGLAMNITGLSAGSVNVTYPVSVSQTMSAPGSFVKPGDQVTFSSNWSAQSGGSISTGASTGSAGLVGSASMNASVGGQVCVITCSNAPVLSVNNSATVPLIPPVSAGTALSAGTAGISGSLTGPTFGVSGTSLSGNTLTAAGSTPIWNISAQLDPFLNAVLGIPAGGSVSAGGASFSYNLLNGQAAADYSSSQTLSFSPMLMETMSFSSPVDYVTYTGGGAPYGSGTAASFSFPAGGKAVVTVPQGSSGPLSYSTSFSIAGTNDFTNNSSITGTGSASFQALSAYASFQNLGQWNGGPVYATQSSAAYTLPLLGNGGAYGSANSWNLGGFSSQAGASGVLQVDSQPPVTTASVSGPTLNQSGWYVGPATVTLSAYDLPDTGASGVATTQYAVDGGPLQTYSGAFTVSGDGTHQVTYFSTDNAGNVEMPQTLTLQIDSTPPTTTSNVTGTAGDNGWFRSGQPVVMTLGATDNAGGSGVAVTYYSVNGGALQEYTSPVTFQNGSYTVSYYSVDVAGNQEAAQSVAFQVDETPPTTVAKPSGTQGHDGWWLSSVSVTLTANDNPGGSGVATTQYVVDGGTLQTYSGPFTVAGDGTHQVTYFSTDNAGNLEAVQTLTVKIDTTPPTTTANVTGEPGSHGWFKAGQPVVLTLGATDNGGSGVATTYYSVNGGAFQAYSSPVVFKDGIYTVSYYSVDVAGNQEATQSVAFQVDQTPPVVTYTGNTGSYTVDQTVDISCTATDNLSGVASTTCTNLDVPAYTLPLGSNTLTAQATDNAGNVGKGSTTFTVSVTPASLCSLTRQFDTKSGVGTSLCAKIDAAAKATSARTADNIYTAYENALRAQTGKSITATQVAILDGYVKVLEGE